MLELLVPALGAKAELPSTIASVAAVSLYQDGDAIDEVEEVTPPLLIEASYTTDILSNISGGIDGGSEYIDNLDVIIDADLDSLIGLKGTSVHIHGLYNNGSSFTSLVGDRQGVSNIETGVEAVRLYEAWISQEISPTASVKFGLYDLNSEFDALDASGLFIGSAHGIGTEFAQSGANGPSIFPITSLAVRLEFEPAQNWKLRAAILDAVPGDIMRPKQTAVKLNEKDGALLVAEIETPLPNGKLLWGHWRYTAPQEMLTGSTATANKGFYLRGEASLFLEDDESQGLDGFFRMGTADERFSYFDRFLSGGLTYTGLFSGRDEDQFGVAFASAFISKGQRQISAGSDLEMAMELTYRGALTPWLTLQPSIHYIVNPGANPAVDNSLVFGLRAEFSFAFFD